MTATGPGATGPIGPQGCTGPPYPSGSSVGSGSYGITGPYGTTGLYGGVYNPALHINYNGSHLRLDYNGGIFLDEGNWTDAAIGLKIELDRRAAGNISVLKFKMGDVIYDVESKQISLDTSGHCLYVLDAKDPEKYQISIETFPILKDHFDKIDKMKAFW